MLPLLSNSAFSFEKMLSSNEGGVSRPREPGVRCCMASALAAQALRLASDIVPGHMPQICVNAQNSLRNSFAVL